MKKDFLNEFQLGMIANFLDNKETKESITRSWLSESIQDDFVENDFTEKSRRFDKEDLKELINFYESELVKLRDILK